MVTDVLAKINPTETLRFAKREITRNETVQTHRNRFLEVQTEIRARMTSDKKTLFAEENASTKPILNPSRVWTKQSTQNAQRVHEQVECFSCSCALR